MVLFADPILVRFLKEKIPLVHDLGAYSTDKLKGDLFAGVTVGVMLIPQGMAIAVIAGMPPIYGLYCAIIPLFIYAILGTSRQMAVGPVALVAFLVYAGLNTVVEPGTSTYILQVFMLSLMVGVIHLFMGIFRLGYLVNFLANPVVSGFTSALALVIILVQVSVLLGLPSASDNTVYVMLSEITANFSNIHLETATLGTVCLLFLLIMKRVKKTFPWGLIALVVSMILVYQLELDKSGVKILREVPSGLPSFHGHAFSIPEMYDLFPLALTIAVIAFVGSISMAKAVHEKHKDYDLRPNQELVAFGFANILGSCFQAFPVAGGLSRTAVNNDAGAKSGVAGLISAMIIGLTLIFLTPAFYYLPNAVLAAIIIAAAYGLIDLKGAARLWPTYKTDFLMWCATFGGTLLLGVQEGIFIGVSISLGTVILKTSRPHMAVLGRVRNTEVYKNVERFEDLDVDPRVLVLRFDDRLYFANVSAFKDKLTSLLVERKDEIDLFVLDAQSISDVDSTGVQALWDVLRFCRTHSIVFLMSSVIGPVRDKLYRSGFVNEMGQGHFHERVHEAILSLEGTREEGKITEFQTNLK